MDIQFFVEELFSPFIKDQSIEELDRGKTYAMTYEMPVGASEYLEMFLTKEKIEVIVEIKKQIQMITYINSIPFNIKFQATNLLEKIIESDLLLAVENPYLIAYALVAVCCKRERGIFIKSRDLFKQSLDDDEFLIEEEIIDMTSKIEEIIHHNDYYIIITQKTALDIFMNESYIKNPGAVTGDDIITAYFLCDCTVYYQDDLKIKPSQIAAHCILFAKMWSKSNYSDLESTWDTTFKPITGYSYSTLASSDSLDKFQQIFEEFSKEESFIMEVYEYCLHDYKAIESFANNLITDKQNKFNLI
jgi:hypothetical protein